MSDRHCDIGGIHLLVHAATTARWPCASAPAMAGRTRADRAGRIRRHARATQPAVLARAWRPVRRAVDTAGRHARNIAKRAELDTQRGVPTWNAEITVAMLAGLPDTPIKR